MCAFIFCALGRQQECPVAHIRPLQPRNLACALAGEHEQFDDRAVVVIRKRIPDEAEFGESSTRSRDFSLGRFCADDGIVLDQTVAHRP